MNIGLLFNSSSNQDESDHEYSRGIAIGAQDVDHSSGSRTGAISIEMLEECDWCGVCNYWTFRKTRIFS